MYQQNQKVRTSLVSNRPQLEGETIEKKMERMMLQGAEMNDVTELIYTDRKDGVIPETNVRTDYMELAIEAAEVGTKRHLAKRDARHNPPADAAGEGKTDDKIG